MTKEEKERRLLELKSRVYDLSAMIEQAQREVLATNQEIGRIAASITVREAREQDAEPTKE